jgi:CBS domain containing-hemolysin-like protein
MEALILVVCTVILISGLCSLFEAVLYSVPQSHIESLVHKKKPAGALLKGLRSNVDEPITAILTLNTVANTAGAALAGAIAARVLGKEFILYFSIAFTAAILVFAEVIPKTVGVVHNRALASLIAFPLILLVKALKPVHYVIGKLTSLISHNKQKETISKMDLIAMARIGLQSGTIDADQMVVIKNILELGSRPVKDVMTPRSVVIAIEENLRVSDALQEEGVLVHSNIPVYGGTLDNITGIVYRRDLLLLSAEDKLTKNVKDLRHKGHSVLETTTLEKALQMFLNSRQHLMTVFDAFGTLSGILSLEDILEEILGREIVGAFDEAVDMRELARNMHKKHS